MPRSAPILAPAPTATQPLYTQRSIRLFSLLFTAVAGGVLTAHNLRAMGRAPEARKALWSSISYTVVMLALIFLLSDASAYGAYVVGSGLAGGYGLNAYTDKFIPNRRAHPALSVWQPLAVCLLVFVPIVALLFYAL